ncbi:MAG: efflux RND transporter permease subunit [Acidobacteria bacterium]|nr:MAG: efflux RND transporter permease subunit [Acidobacteriota bacterium]
MRALAELAVRRPVGVLVVAAGVALLGMAAWGTLPVDLLPDLQSPTVVVSLRAGDRPPTEIERRYGEQVEQRLFAVRGIRHVTTIARPGRLITRVEFTWRTPMDRAVVEVQKAISPLAGDPDVDELIVRRFDPRQEPVLSIGLVASPGGPDLVELRRIARRQLAPALERLEGVAEARVLGGREREVAVLVDPVRLAGHGLTVRELAGRIREANADLEAGTLEQDGEVLVVRGLTRYRRPGDVAAALVRIDRDPTGRPAPLRVGDLARVEYREQPITHLVRVDGVEGVGLSVYKEAGANTVEVSTTVRDALPRLVASAPGVEARVISDQAALIEDAIGEVESAALIGIALAVFVLGMFLRSFGATLVVSLAVPISLLATVLGFSVAGLSLNVMTLGGLALGAGMLVDNAIVVVESIHRRLEGRGARDEAIVAGTAQVAGAIAASTLTTCAVFLPVIFVRGLAARLVAGLSFAVVVSLLASLVVALLVIPALARWVGAGRGAATPRARERFEAFIEHWLGHSVAVVLVALVVVGAGAAVLVRLGTELLPPADPRQLAVRIVGPPGQRVEATAASVATVEQVLRAAGDGHVVGMLAEVGRLPLDDRAIREELDEENTARLVVRLDGEGPTARTLVERARPAIAQLARLEVQWDVGASALARTLGTSGPPIVVELRSDALEDLVRGAEAVSREMAAEPALWDVETSFEGGPPELRVGLDRLAADARGIDRANLEATLAAALDGHRATRMAIGDEEYDVVVHLPRSTLRDLARLPLLGEGGARATVGEVSRFEIVEGVREIRRRDQRRVARVTARVAADATYPAARAAALAALARAPIPPGVRGTLAGEEEERAETVRQLGFALALAVVLVFMVLAASFESLVHPLTVLTALPLGLPGVALALAPGARPLGVMALLGLVMLAGIAVNDAILLVATARDMQRAGTPRRRALARAAAIRLRPILMTTATTVFALVPLAFGGGEGAELRAPLALTVIGGLVASTIGSLLVVPCVYELLDRLGRGGRTPR